MSRLKIVGFAQLNETGNPQRQYSGVDGSTRHVFSTDYTEFSTDYTESGKVVGKMIAELKPATLN